MNNIKATERLNAAELEHGLTGSNSWHSQYKDSAYVYVGGLSFDLTEGDVIAVMSQWVHSPEPVLCARAAARRFVAYFFR